MVPGGEGRGVHTGRNLLKELGIVKQTVKQA